MRAVEIQPRMISAMTMEKIPVPKNMINSVATTTWGNAPIISQIRIITISTLPP